MDDYTPYLGQATRIVISYYNILRQGLPVHTTSPSLSSLEEPGIAKSQILSLAIKCALQEVKAKIETVKHQESVYCSMVAWKVNSGKIGDYMREACRGHINSLQCLRQAIELLAAGTTEEHIDLIKKATSFNNERSEKN